MTTESADYCMFLTEWAWSRSRVCLLTLEPLMTSLCTRHATLAACYQLAQSVLKIGFALAKKVG